MVEFTTKEGGKYNTPEKTSVLIQTKSREIIVALRGVSLCNCDSILTNVRNILQGVSEVAELVVEH
jgi:hypothetical protein